MNMKNDFAFRLERLRAEKGLRQTEAAEKLGINRTTYNAYENCKNEPPIDTLTRIADLYDVSTDYLLGRTTERRLAGDELAKRLDTLAYLCSQNDAHSIDYNEMLAVVNALIDYYHTRQRADNMPIEYTRKLLATLAKVIAAASGDSLSALHIATNELALVALDASRDMLSVYMK